MKEKNSNNKSKNKNKDKKRVPYLTDQEYRELEEERKQIIGEANRNYGIISKLSVSQGIRAPTGSYIIVGQIATVSSVYKMVSGVNLKCLDCGNEWSVDYRPKPVVHPVTIAILQ